VLILVLLLVTVMFYVDYFHFTDSFVFHCVFVSALIEVLIYLAAECLINLLTYLLTTRKCCVVMLSVAPIGVPVCP